MTTRKAKRNSREGNCHKTKHDWHDRNTESSRSDEMKRVTADAGCSEGGSGSGEEQRGRRHAAKSAETNGQATALSVRPPLLYEAQREVTALFNKPGQNVCDRFPVEVSVKCRGGSSLGSNDLSLHSICCEWV